MYTVIIAGGSGTRLWPLSQPNYPKHLLNLNGENSLIQDTVNRALGISIAEKIFIVSDASHAEHIYEQVPMIPLDNIIVEPARRGTASCVVAALSKLKYIAEIDEPIVFMHADHLIRDSDSFTSNIIEAGEISTQQKSIVLLGANPDYPATCFGYIHKGQHRGKNNVFHVESFTEKPDLTNAKKYVSCGEYLWNMGYFMGSIAIFEDSLRASSPLLWSYYNRLSKAKDNNMFDTIYQSFKSEAIDTALIEKLKNLLVICGTFDWVDIGTYQELHKTKERDSQGNSISGPAETYQTKDCLVINTTELPVAILGADNLAVIVTENGVLITHKDLSAEVGNISKKLLLAK